MPSSTTPTIVAPSLADAVSKPIDERSMPRPVLASSPPSYSVAPAPDSEEKAVASHSPSPSSPSPSLAHHDARTGAHTHLPPVDRGAAAYIFLVCGFFIWLMVWGVAYSYGTFQDYHTHSPHSPLHRQSSTLISAIGTLVIGIQHFIPLVLRGFFIRYAHRLKPISLVSLLLSAICLLVASFAGPIWIVVLFHGVLFGFASGIIFSPVILWLPQWFDKRRGMATGLIFMGSGVGGVAAPLILNALLLRVGFAWTMRVYALTQLVITGTALVFLKPRIPAVRPQRQPDSTTEAVPRSWRQRIAPFLPGNLLVLLTPLALIITAVLLLQACGWYTISLYIATYCSQLGFSASTSTGVLSAFNASAVVGYVGTGPAIDRFSYLVALMLSSGLCGIAALTMFGFAIQLPLLVVFVLFFGAAGGGFGCFLTPMARTLSDSTSTAGAPTDVSLLFLALMFIRGIAAVGGPLIASALYDAHTPGGQRRWGEYGIDGFRPLILFVGTTMLAAAVLAAGLIAVTREKRSAQRREREEEAEKQRDIEK
ncbi:hypothetical protein ACQY0O_002340 [Thecaphora frezii]